MRNLSDVIRHVAAGLRDRGYVVEIQPRLEEHGEVLAPDIIARRGEETRVVEVAARGKRLGHDVTRWRERHPDWQFDVVVVSDIDDEGSLQLDERVAAAERLLKSGENDAALLLAWGAFEAVARACLSARGLNVEKATPAALVQALAREGLVPDDYGHLIDMMRIRNGVAHGRASRSFPDDTWRLLSIIRQLAAPPATS